MYFAGIQRTSTLDYPKEVCAVLFTDVCNFKCPFCHNPELISAVPEKQRIPEKKIIETLLARKYLVNAVSITGGEPTLQKDLPSFIRKLKDNGFLVKIDTNGTNPDMIKELLPHLDFIAMDVKAEISNSAYSKTIGVSANISLIKKSIKLIMNSGIEYEFRTTVLPELHPIVSFETMGEQIKGAKKIAIQQFQRESTFDPTFKTKAIYEPDELQEIKQILEKYVKNVEIRGI